MKSVVTHSGSEDIIFLSELSKLSFSSSVGESYEFDTVTINDFHFLLYSNKYRV